MRNLFTRFCFVWFHHFHIDSREMLFSQSYFGNFTCIMLEGAQKFSVSCYTLDPEREIHWWVGLFSVLRVALDNYHWLDCIPWSLSLNKVIPPSPYRWLCLFRDVGLYWSHWLNFFSKTGLSALYWSEALFVFVITSSDKRKQQRLQDSYGGARQYFCPQEHIRPLCSRLTEFCSLRVLVCKYK